MNLNGVPAGRMADGNLFKSCPAGCAAGFSIVCIAGAESGEGFESELVLLFGIFAAFCFGKRKKPRIFVSKRRLCELYHIVH